MSKFEVILLKCVGFSCLGELPIVRVHIAYYSTAMGGRETKSRDVCGS